MSSLVDDVKTKTPTCTICDAVEEVPAVFYCQNCGKNMCKSCEKGHSTWKPFTNHVVVTMSDVLSGKVQLKRRRECRKHPGESEECFCTGCREYICFRCGMMDHSLEGHRVIEAAIHEGKLMENIKGLKERAKSKKTILEEHIKFIGTRRMEVMKMMRKLYSDIDKTYKECVQILSDRRETLKSRVELWSEIFETKLHVMEEESSQTINHMAAVEELVTNGMNVQLEKDALSAHDTHCEKLENILAEDCANVQPPRDVVERAQQISFRKYLEERELYLGDVEDHKLTSVLIADVELPRENNMNCVARTPAGKMAVGLQVGGIQLYSPAGKLHGTVLKECSVHGIGFLSDGRSVVYDAYNKMSLYSPNWKKLDVGFETMSGAEGTFGGLTVDSNDDIFVAYRNPNKIQSQRNLLVSWSGKIVCLDSMGNKKNVLEEKTMFAYPAVCRDDSVIVAWVKPEKSHLLVDRYTTF
ncbi:uncharacterized protein [Diadema antillarum]|uniref:uncharacterized protein n=1 Tax=Diadema antillarum TaxID=105358 RepID=UPI003A836C9E